MLVLKQKLLTNNKIDKSNKINSYFKYKVQYLVMIIIITQFIYNAKIV